MAQMVKNPPTMQETSVQSLCWEDPLVEGMATHSCLENPHGQKSLAGYSPRGGRVEHGWATKLSSARQYLFILLFVSLFRNVLLKYAQRTCQIEALIVF